MVNIDSYFNPYRNQHCNLYRYYCFPLMCICYQCLMTAY